MCMNPRVVGAMLLVMVAACFTTGAIVYPILPSHFVSHWNAGGQANGTISAFAGAFLLPLIMLAAVIFWAILPFIDPIAPGFKGFRYVYDFIIFLMIAFMAYIYALTLGANLGWRLAMPTLILLPLAAFMFILGALLPYIKRNWFVGIRTPWTISNDIAWNKTHRFGRVLFEISAAFILIAAFVPKTLTLWFIFVPLIGATLAIFIYSYFVYIANLRAQ